MLYEGVGVLLDGGEGVLLDGGEGVLLDGGEGVLPDGGQHSYWLPLAGRWNQIKLVTGF